MTKGLACVNAVPEGLMVDLKISELKLDDVNKSSQVAIGGN